MPPETNYIYINFYSSRDELLWNEGGETWPHIPITGDLVRSPKGKFFKVIRRLWFNARELNLEVEEIP